MPGRGVPVERDLPAIHAVLRHRADMPFVGNAVAHDARHFTGEVDRAPALPVPQGHDPGLPVVPMVPTVPGGGPAWRC